MLVRARLALEDQAGAEEALRELHSTASAVTTDAMQGSIRFAEGLVAAAARDHKSAKERFEDAMYRFDHCGAPFETARARLELARSLLVLGRPDAAELQAGDALDSLQALGAAVEESRATALLRGLQTSSRTATGSTLAAVGLSQREVEVLRLVAQGLSNQEIATHLVLSKHTVHRHISNILTKLNLPSRAAAATFAARHDLL